MEKANYETGDSFRVQFAWKLPKGDFIRAIFEVEVLLVDLVSNKYVLQLIDFLAGRQESDTGEMRSLDRVSRDYWALVANLPGKKISLAFEADDGRPLWLRLETLTGQHDFFSRLSKIPFRGEQSNSQ